MEKKIHFSIVLLHSYKENNSFCCVLPTPAVFKPHHI